MLYHQPGSMWDTTAGVLLPAVEGHQAVVNGLNLEREKHHVAGSSSSLAV